MFHIPLPALREHKEDIPVIADALIAESNRKNGCRVTDIHPAAIEELQNHHWPGNVSQLRNVVERAVVLAAEGAILAQHLHLTPRPTKAVEPSSGGREGVLESPVDGRLRDVEKADILMTLKHANNNKRRTAAI